MNILIISNIELDTKNASGNTYANWLSGWSDTKIACIYCRDTYPNNEFCNEYFSVSPFCIIKNVFKPWRIGRHFYNTIVSQLETIVGGSESKIIQKSKHSDRRFYYLVNDLLYKSKIWMNKRYKEFIGSFNPNIVFFFAKSDAFIEENLKYIRKHTSAKCVAFYADDVYRRFQNSEGLIYRIFERRFPKVVKLADFHFGASHLMCEDYGKLFNIPMLPLYKGCEIFQTKDSVNVPIRIVYAGNLYYGREKTLFKMVDAIKEVNKAEVKILLEIYTSAEITENIDKKLNISNASKIMGPKPYEDIIKIMHEADIVLHVESFLDKNIESVRLSYSTKISDCLQSGSMLLAIGPRDIASIEEAIVIPGAYVVSEEQKIYSAIEDIVACKAEIPSQAKLINNYAKEHFPISIVRENLKKTFYTLIERG